MTFIAQTPLHLAALRGNAAAVEYLIKDCGADTTKRDRNGLNPLDLSVKKFQLKTEWTIRRLTHSGTFAIFLSLGRNRLRESTYVFFSFFYTIDFMELVVKTSFYFVFISIIFLFLFDRILMYLFFGANEQEITAWAWRIVFLSNFAGSCVSFTLAISDVLADLAMLHCFTSIVQVIWWLCFTLCFMKSPTFVREEGGLNSSGSEGMRKDGKGKGKSKSNVITYAGILDQIGSSTGEEGHVQVCHSCRVVRPLRSKHCKLLRRCVQRV